jgi:hypothetical protein
MTNCQIQWIDPNGNLTPDSNPSIGQIRTKNRVEQIGGRGVRFSASQWFHVCADHAKRLADPGMDIWEWRDCRDGKPMTAPTYLLECRGLD